MSAKWFWSILYQGCLSKPTEAKVVLPGVFWGALHLCHFGVKVGDVVSTNQRCPSMHYPVAILVRRLRLVCAMSPRLTEGTGQLGCWNCALVCDFKMKKGV